MAPQVLIYRGTRAHADLSAALFICSAALTMSPRVMIPAFGLKFETSYKLFGSGKNPENKINKEYRVQFLPAFHHRLPLGVADILFQAATCHIR